MTEGSTEHIETPPLNFVEPVGEREVELQSGGKVDLGNLDEKIGSIVSSSVNSAIERVEKDFISNLSKISEEIAQLRSELSETVKNFNEAVRNLNELALELRVSISDIDNPFSSHSSNGNGWGMSNGNGINYRVMEKVLRELWKYSETYDINTLKELIQDYVESGIVEKSSGEAVLKLIDHMYKLKPKGFTIDDSIRFLQAIKGVGNGR